MTTFPSPPLDQIPLGPGEFLMVDGFDVPAVLSVIRHANVRIPLVRVALAYVDGFGGFGPLERQVPPEVKAVSISVTHHPANFGDDEQFALTDRTYREWRITDGEPIGGKIGLYKSVSGMDSMGDLPDWKWAAHYGWRGGGISAAHICSPNTCGLTSVHCGASQCYDVGPNGENVDISIASAGFLGIDQPQPTIITLEDGMDVSSHSDPDGTNHVFLTVPHDGKDPSKGGTLYELYHYKGKPWEGSEKGKQRALAYKLVSIPENVG